MSQKRPSTWGNPDHRRQSQLPAPPIAQIEHQLFSLLNPGSFKPLRLAQGEKKLRDRLLTLPVMMAVVVSLVYRQIPGLSEILRVLENLLSVVQTCRRQGRSVLKFFHSALNTYSKLGKSSPSLLPDPVP
jgi:hypothetical protein